jgi:hypothetical protein
MESYQPVKRLKKKKKKMMKKKKKKEKEEEMVRAEAVFSSLRVEKVGRHVETRFGKLGLHKRRIYVIG